MKTFYKGAMLLIVAAFIGECLDVLINVVLARELGEEGLGFYMSILPTVVFVVVIASIELPVSISKFVAEKEETYHRSMLKHTLVFATIWTLLFIIVAIWTLPFLPIFDRYHPLVPWLFIGLIPLITFSSVAKGYFMGVQQMSKIALGNLIERFGQLILLFFIFKIVVADGEMAIFIALFALVASEILSFSYLFCSFLLRMNVLKKRPSSSITGRKVREALLQVSVPTTGLRIFHAATFAIKPFLIKEALVRGGMAETVAIAQYGNMAGVAFTIGFFPAFIAHSLLIVLIPTVSEAYAKGDIPYLHSLLKKVMAFTAGYGIPAILIFFYFAEPLTSFFFENSPAIRYLQLLVLYFLFNFFVMPLQAFLIGLGLVKDAFLHAVYSTLFSFTLMFFLGALPSFQMDGIIIGMNFGTVLLAFLHFVTICKKIRLNIFLWK